MADATPLAVGLVGAGPWARMFHAPMLSGGSETRLAAVWARRPEAAVALAERHQAQACASFDELVDTCDAVAFCVPPAVQVDLAVAAARAGRTVLLEKPLADDLDGARRIADAVAEAGVGSLVLLTARYSDAVVEFLASVVDRQWFGARFWNLNGAFLDGPFSTSPWRHERGPLLDIGPHALDLVTAALGPVASIRATRSAGGFDAVTVEHESGAVSDLALCCRVAELAGNGFEIYGAGGSVTFDVNHAWGVGDLLGNVRRALVAVAHGGSHPCDADRGLQLQQWLHDAEHAGR